VQAALLAQRTRDGGAYRLACLSARPLKSQLPPAQTVRRPPSSAPPSSRAHLKSAMMYTIHSWPRRNRTNIAQLPPPFILAPPRPENIGPIFILWRACGWHARHYAYHQRRRVVHLFGARALLFISARPSEKRKSGGDDLANGCGEYEK